MIKTKLFSPILYLLSPIVLLFILTLISCSTQKPNRGLFFLNFGTKYNIVYNGKSLLDQGRKTIDETVHDNFQQHLSVFKEPNEASTQQNKALMDSLIGKSTRIINEKAKSKYVDDAYLLKGKANYYLGNYFVANEFFDYILKNLHEDPQIKQEALIWRANSLIQLDNTNEALKVLDAAFANSENEDRFKGLLYAVQAKYYLQEKDQDAAIDMLSKAIEYSRQKKNKLRWHYLLGQLLFEKGDNTAAYVHFSKVVKSNESYEMAFHANLYRVEILNKDNPGVETRVALLKKLLRDNKNKNYKGQIYQRIGDAYATDHQTDKAIHHYELAIKHSQNNNFQQSINFLTLADLFFDQGMYNKASLYYDSTMQVLPKDNANYDPIQRKTSNLSALVKQLTIISYQDTLLRLAALPPAEREMMIDSILENRLALAQASLVSERQDLPKNTPLDINNDSSLQRVDPNQTFYFNNTSAISQGYSTFKKRWGNRQLADNWRYSNKSQLVNTDILKDGDSLPIEDDQVKAEMLKDTWRAEYVNNIPSTKEALDTVHHKIKQAYLSLAEIYQNALYDGIEAAKTYETLLERFPEINNADLVYYHLYRLYADKDAVKSTYYRDKLISGFPDSKYARAIKDPDYYKKQGDLLQRFNDYYSSIYELFNEKKYDELIHSTQSAIQEKQYDALGNTAQLAYLQALAIGRICEIEYFEESLSKIIEQYPNDELVVPLVKQHIAYIEAHPDQFAGRGNALEDIDQDRKRFIDEPVITPWPELSYNRQYNIPQSIPQDRKNYGQVSSITSLNIGQQSKENRKIQHQQLEIGNVSENRHENSYRNLDLLPSEANYYFVINVLYGNVNLSPSRYGIGQFNRGQYPNMPISHQLKNIAGENQLIYIGVFSSFEEVKSYETKIKPLLNSIMKIPEDAYNSFIITESNFNTLTDFDKIDDYHTTYTQEP